MYSYIKRWMVQLPLKMISRNNFYMLYKNLKLWFEINELQITILNSYITYISFKNNNPILIFYTVFYLKTQVHTLLPVFIKEVISSNQTMYCGNMPVNISRNTPHWKNNEQLYPGTRCWPCDTTIDH